jgi:hypothetical protein
MLKATILRGCAPEARSARKRAESDPTVDGPPAEAGFDPLIKLIDCSGSSLSEASIENKGLVGFVS